MYVENCNWTQPDSTEVGRSSEFRRWSWEATYRILGNLEYHQKPQTLLWLQFTILLIRKHSYRVIDRGSTVCGLTLSKTLGGRTKLHIFEKQILGFHARKLALNYENLIGTSGTLDFPSWVPIWTVIMKWITNQSKTCPVILLMGRPLSMAIWLRVTRSNLEYCNFDNLACESASWDVLVDHASSQRIWSVFYSCTIYQRCFGWGLRKLLCPLIFVINGVNKFAVWRMVSGNLKSDIISRCWEIDF